MKQILCSLLVLLTGVLSAQISTTKAASSPKTFAFTQDNPDTLRNFLGYDYKNYIGQELYLVPLKAHLKQSGYSGFLMDYRKPGYEEKNIYKYEDGHSNADAMAGAYFTVQDAFLNVKKNTATTDTTYYLKLQRRDSKDLVYYTYDPQFYLEFPFIRTEYFQKAKSAYIGKIYVSRGKTNSNFKDLNTGTPVDFAQGTEWKCTDVTVDEKEAAVSLILENQSQKTMVPLKTLLNNWVSFEKGQAEKYKAEFGEEEWKKIQKGDPATGMTRRMCFIAWGEPRNTSTAMSEGVLLETWDYKHTELVFSGDKLVLIREKN